MQQIFGLIFVDFSVKQTCLLYTSQEGVAEVQDAAGDAAAVHQSTSQHEAGDAQQLIDPRVNAALVQHGFELAF